MRRAKNAPLPPGDIQLLLNPHTVEERAGADGVGVGVTRRADLPGDVAGHKRKGGGAPRLVARSRK